MLLMIKFLLGFDVAVLGAGIHGSCAALQLARTGKRVVLIEQFAIPHTRGSSGGQSRIIRSANFGHPAMMPLMMDAFREWTNIQKEFGQELLRKWPLLSLMDSSSKESLNDVFHSLEVAGLIPELIPIEEINEKYGTNFPADTKAFFDNSAGVLFANKCLIAAQKLFEKAGGKIMDRWPVKSVKIHSKTHVEFIGTNGSLNSSSAVLCPGPWAQSLLGSIGVHLPLRAIYVNVHYFKLKHDKPSLNFLDARGPEGHFFGTPEMEYPGKVKICFHGGADTEPNSRDDVDLSYYKQLIQNYTNTYFPFVNSQHSIEEPCMYTLTPDAEFILDYHPEFSNVVFACGFSGSGFKFAPSLAKVIRDMIEEATPTFDVSPFSMKRFSDSECKT